MFGYQVAFSLAMTVIIPCVVGVIYFRKLSKAYKYLVMLLGMHLFSELLLITLAYLGVNNLIYLHLYAPLEIILLSTFFIHQLRSLQEKRIIWAVTFVITAISLIYSLVGNNIAGFNSFPRAIECMYFSLLACYVFYDILVDPGPVDDGFYIVNGAVLFYFSSCFLVFAFSKYIAPDNKSLLMMSNIHSIIIAVCNIAYATGLWIASKYSSSYSPV
jgi:hypothetical protein